MRLSKLHQDQKDKKKKKAFEKVSADDRPKSKKSKNQEQDDKEEQDAKDRSWAMMQSLQYSVPDRGPNTNLQGQLDRAS